MKKLFVALASVALVGTAFAQTAAPAPAGSKATTEATMDHAGAVKGKSATQSKADKGDKDAAMAADAKTEAGTGNKADTKADAATSTGKSAQHKVSKGNVNKDTVKHVDARHVKAEAKPAAVKTKAETDVTAPAVGSGDAKAAAGAGQAVKQ